MVKVHQFAQFMLCRVVIVGLIGFVALVQKNLMSAEDLLLSSDEDLLLTLPSSAASAAHSGVDLKNMQLNHSTSGDAVHSWLKDRTQQSNLLRDCRHGGQPSMFCHMIQLWMWC